MSIKLLSCRYPLFSPLNESLNRETVRIQSKIGIFFIACTGLSEVQYINYLFLSLFLVTALME